MRDSTRLVDGIAHKFGDALPPSPVDGTLEEARRRLKSAALETRDITSADPGVASFLPTGAPTFVAEEFALALRARAALPDLLRVRPLAERGGRVDVPRFAAGSSAAVVSSEGAFPAGGQTDVDLDTVSAAKVTIVGRQTLSLQAFEFANENFDVALAADLGAAIAATLDLADRQRLG